MEPAYTRTNQAPWYSWRRFPSESLSTTLNSVILSPYGIFLILKGKEEDYRKEQRKMCYLYLFHVLTLSVCIAGKHIYRASCGRRKPNGMHSFRLWNYYGLASWQGLVYPSSNTGCRQWLEYYCSPCIKFFA